MAVDIPAGQLDRAWIVPWEVEDGQFGIAYQLHDGSTGAGLIGTREQADTALKTLLAEHPSDQATILPFPKDIAAS